MDRPPEVMPAPRAGSTQQSYTVCGTHANSVLQSQSMVMRPNVPQRIRDTRSQRTPGNCALADRWYLAYTKPHAEERAITNLQRQSYLVFCPRTHKTIRHARKLTRVLAPLFPSYLFVRIDVSRDHWFSVNGTRGVVKLITQGDTPLPVPEGVVEALQARMDFEGAMNWSSSLRPGQTVRIFDGPFADLVGTLETLDACGRVHVLLDLLGRSVSVALRGEALVPVA
jgi:transcription elongation factor/antiterminator RfaH